MSHPTTRSVQIVLPQHCNGAERPRLFGGQMMAWIDVIGAVAARRYTQRNVTTACVDSLSFLSAAYPGDTVTQEADITWTGRTYLEVRVRSYVEHLDGSRTLANRAYLIYVALDEEGNPTPVKPFVPETNEEKLEWAAAEERKKARRRE